MNGLHELQQSFAGVIFDGEDNGFDQAIKADGLTGARRLQIYHNSTYINLINALIAVFPVVHRLVGDEFFRMMAREYIQAHPSVSGNLHDFGDCFSSFINDFTAAKQLVYLADVAKLEWAYHVVFHAADCAYFDVTKLYTISEQQYEYMTFRLNPASQLLSSDYPVLEIWQTNQAENQQVSAVDLDVGGCKILIIRRNQQIEFESLSKGEYIFLDSLKKGDKFPLACELAMQADPESVVEQIFQSHVQAKTIIDFTIDSTSEPTG